MFLGDEMPEKITVPDLRGGSLELTCIRLVARVRVGEYRGLDVGLALGDQREGSFGEVQKTCASREWWRIRGPDWQERCLGTAELREKHGGGGVESWVSGRVYNLEDLNVGSEAIQSSARELHAGCWTKAA